VRYVIYIYIYIYIYDVSRLRVNQTRIFATDFRKILRYKILTLIRSVGAEMFTRIDRHT
jgi:hypothetical protein